MRRETRRVRGGRQGRKTRWREAEKEEGVRREEQGTRGETERQAGGERRGRDTRRRETRREEGARREAEGGGHEE